MGYNPDHHHRRSIRLQGYDYSQAGAYFVTLCAWNRVCIFGDMSEGQMQLNSGGQAAEKCWLSIPEHFPHVQLDAFVIMPNHVHGIIWIIDTVCVGPNVGAKNFSPLQPNTSKPISPSKTVGSIVRGFKIGVTKWYRSNTDTHQVWQRNYFEHVIRDDKSLNRIREYIIENPTHWAQDRENPKFFETDAGENITTVIGGTQGRTPGWTGIGTNVGANVVAKNFSPLQHGTGKRT